MVRILCHSRKFIAAEEEVERLNDPAAAFHLARQYEAFEKIPDAIRYYSQARRYSHGVRLAKKYEMDSELTNLALKSTPNVMIDAADYLNEKVMRPSVSKEYVCMGYIDLDTVVPHLRSDDAQG